ncbi:Eco57I restriction-modification methylase domain-containing protein [Arthrospira platensis]|uniref:Eco57I restriction-modification methylase domain-containing protein n=1 Tax=Limnospira TaxID=2596745 RepID=UPI0001C39174|nr:TaqI-like C-terminal specificity domain-containing protein [Arthrospira platensis]KDR55390.1 type IIS restriction endonuclease [Arthrospira platensis str. Paraca]MBD2670319.1 Eco57I restriction-modification methylase domain-containing protein [Arthrospira platensis FACHB-439]MBD2710941.1 Eco57I restriction-modification methylase domain-containing protein [Arthrospira platensis FACHB-835]MDT9311260.1 TaqI-like C-terminal specificity domain-containing protein [Limnospira sp. Paracas R14]QQW29
MPNQRLLGIEDIRGLTGPEKIADLFRRLGYDTCCEEFDPEDVDLSDRHAEAVDRAYLIAQQENGDPDFKVILFQLRGGEWETPSTASGRMKAIANQLGQQSTEFLLMATKDYNQLMLVNPRKAFDENKNIKGNIRKLLIDRTNPTAYDRDRLEALAVKGKSPSQLYQAHCEAFDVEQLTKSFYRGYRDLFERVKAVVMEYNPHPYFQDGDRLHQFSQRLLGRLMFLYFLQKKEFLAGDRQFLTHQYRKNGFQSEDCDYYRDILEPLFFDTLNRQRPDCESPWGKIPYLNGGLFERDYGEGIRDAAGRETPEAVRLPNSIFDPADTDSILSYFNGYNFTVAENVAGDEDVAVDPEMLGKVFENMLEVEERGKSGTFYTPRGIVQFMCSEVLCRYLADETGMELETVGKLIDYDPNLTDSDFNQLMSSQQVRSLKKALDNIKVLDPAVGSGAFPLGMLQIMVNVRQAIARREGMTVKRGSLTISQWKRDMIANNLYGVDIKPEAIEIAKLRMWLSLVVDIPSIEDVEPLPNLDYKLMCGNSLISTIHGEQLIPDPTKDQQGTLAITPIQTAIQPLLALQKQYFDAQTEERYQLRKQILEAEMNVFRVAVQDRIQYLQGQLKECDIDIQSLKKPTKILLDKRDNITDKLTNLTNFWEEVNSGKISLNFFQYHLHFRDVFDEKGGFDVVIGNPPYVRQEAIKELKPALKAEYECYTGVADLYVYFYERGLSLLKSGGHLTYISSNKYFRAGYGEKLRKFLGEKAKVDVLIDFGDASVFEAIAYPSIILLNKAKPDNHQARVFNWEIGQSIDEFAAVFKKQNFLLLQKELTADGWRLESPATLRLLDKLRAAGTPLGEYVNGRFYYGIKTGYNEAFVVDRETRDRLIAEHPSSQEVLKPFLRGRDVKRWCVDWAEQYLIKIESSENKKHPWSDAKTEKEAEKIFAKTYPAIYFKLECYRDRLIKRCDQGKYFWELRSCAYWQEFKQPKIILRQIMDKATFALDIENFYFNDTLFMIPINNKVIVAILNSSIVWWFLINICNDLQNGFLRAYKEQLKQVPIPSVHESDYLAIERLVQKCLDAKGVGVEEWEAEIDDRVADLYGLTAEEMRIIRGD